MPLLIGSMPSGRTLAPGTENIGLQYPRYHYPNAILSNDAQIGKGPWRSSTTASYSLPMPNTISFQHAPLMGFPKPRSMFWVTDGKPFLCSTIFNSVRQSVCPVWLVGLKINICLIDRHVQAKRMVMNGRHERIWSVAAPAWLSPHRGNGKGKKQNRFFLLGKQKLNKKCKKVIKHSWAKLGYFLLNVIAGASKQQTWCHRLDPSSEVPRKRNPQDNLEDLWVKAATMEVTIQNSEYFAFMGQICVFFCY